MWFPLLLIVVWPHTATGANLTDANCTAPTGILNVADEPCNESSVVSDGGSCTPQCAGGWPASVEALQCDGGELIPATFHCPVLNLALGKPPMGSSESKSGKLIAATDGSAAKGHWWRPAGNEYPSWLRLDMGERAVVLSMRVTGGTSGFRALRVYRSTDLEAWSDGLASHAAWAFVREDKTPSHCQANHTSVHDGWAEPTRYIMLQFEHPCGGLPPGRANVAEWEVWGYYEPGMVRKYKRTWPLCRNLWAPEVVGTPNVEGPDDDAGAACFSFMDLEDAKEACLSAPECDGFSFSSAQMGGGRGSGCFKTGCGNGGDAGLAHGSFGYWEKRRGPVNLEELLRPHV